MTKGANARRSPPRSAAEDGEPDGDAAVNRRAPARAAPVPDWRDWLRELAHSAQRSLLGRRDQLRSAGEVSDLPGRIAVDGTMAIEPLVRSGFSPHRAREALLTVDRFVLGWCLDQAAVVEQGSGNSPAGRDTDFEFGLEVLIGGLEAVGEHVPASALRMRRRAVSMGMRTLLRHLRQSAETAYPADFGFGELERRLLTEIYTTPTLRASDLIARSGVDKAQVSRTLRRLTDAGAVERRGSRGQFMLSPAGMAQVQAIIAIAGPRRAELITGIDPDDLREFLDMVGEMTVAAVRLLDQELMLAGPRREGVAAIGESESRTVGEPLRLVPRLMTLFTYLQRSGALMIRRLSDLANFEWMVLSTIAEAEPLRPARLVAALVRDHSQARRTVRRLIERGLVHQVATRGQRVGMLRLTERGRAVARTVEEEGWRRDAALFGSIDPQRLERFLATLDRLTENAEEQLARQRAASAASSFRTESVSED